MIWHDKQSRIEKVNLKNISNLNIELAILREDELHAEISGNKYRKLKYNLIKAYESGHSTLLTFGGAYSNHIAAVAAAGKEFGFNTIGVIRGDELAGKYKENPTLRKAEQNGMRFHFVSREDYRKKDSSCFIEDLHLKFGEFYLIPEGGTNELAVKGCEEILCEHTHEYDYICCAAGTAGTASGLLRTIDPHQKLLVFPALKDPDFLNEVIKTYTNRLNYELIVNYHFGGYAKYNKDLINFVNEFKNETQIQLEPVYTGKMVFGLIDLIRQGYFESGSKILIIHTGGLQGIEGINQNLIKKNFDTIK